MPRLLREILENLSGVFVINRFIFPFSLYNTFVLFILLCECFVSHQTLSCLLLCVCLSQSIKLLWKFEQIGFVGFDRSINYDDGTCIFFLTLEFIYSFVYMICPFRNPQNSWYWECEPIYGVFYGWLFHAKSTVGLYRVFVLYINELQELNSKDLLNLTEDLPDKMCNQIEVILIFNT